MVQCEGRLQIPATRSLSWKAFQVGLPLPSYTSALTPLISPPPREPWCHRCPTLPTWKFPPSPCPAGLSSYLSCASLAAKPPLPTHRTTGSPSVAPTQGLGGIEVWSPHFERPLWVMTQGGYWGGAEGEMKSLGREMNGEDSSIPAPHPSLQTKSDTKHCNKDPPCGFK